MRAALIISLLMLASCGEGVPLQPPGTCEFVESHLEAIIAEVDSVYADPAP